MVDKVFKYLLLLSPIASMKDVSLFKFDLAFFYIGTIALFGVSLIDKPKREIPGKIFLVLLLGLCLFNISMHNLDYIVLSCSVNICLAVLVISILVRYLENYRECYKYIVIAGMLNIVFLLFNYLGFNPLLEPASKEFGGIMGNAPRLGTYLAISWPFFAKTPLGIIPIVTALFLKEIMIFPIVALIAFLRFKSYGNKSIVILLLISAIIILWPKIAYSIKLRIEIWKPTLECFLSQPMIGLGLGNFKKVTESFKLFNAYSTDYAFNSYLQFVFGVGVLGIAWLVAVIRQFIRRFNYDVESFAVLGLLMISFVEYPFEIKRLWFTIIGIISFFMIKNGGCYEGKKA